MLTKPSDKFSSERTWDTFNGVHALNRRGSVYSCSPPGSRKRHSVPRLGRLGSTLAVLLSLTGQPRTAARAQAPQAAQILVRLEGDPAPEIRAGLQQALSAQLASLDVALDIGTSNTVGASIRQRVAAGQALANATGAILVCWLEIDPKRWRLLALDPAKARLLTRESSIAASAEQAAVEAIAVIVRDASRAVLQGGEVTLPEVPREAPKPTTGDVPGEVQPEQVQPEQVQPRPTAETTPPAPSPTPSTPAAAPADALPGLETRLDAFWAALAYRGQNVGDTLPWAHGLAVHVAWQWSATTMIGLEYTWVPAKNFSNKARFRLHRIPFSLQLGYRIPAEPLQLIVTGSAILELQHRTTPRDQSNVDAFDAKTRPRYGLAPGVRLEFRATDFGGLFAALDMTVYFNNFNYRLEGDDRVTLLEQHPASVRTALGLWLTL